MFYIYVIKSEKGKYYTGHTCDLTRRLEEHNSGYCKSTKSDKNWKIIYTESFHTRSEAMKREKWFKTGVGRSYLKDKGLRN